MNLKQAGILGFYAGVAIGGGVASFFTKRHLQMKYEQIADEEIRQARDFYDRKYKTKSPGDVLVELHGEDLMSEKLEEVSDAVKSLGYSVVDSSTERDQEAALRSIHGESHDVEIHENVFESVNAWDWEHELQYRAQQPGIPYAITDGEYNQNDPEHEQISLTWWVDEEVLADDQEQHVPDPDDLVGIENLDKFGHGSNDRNVVYVRNDKKKLDFMICLQYGSYAKTVLGFDDSLQHADRPRNRRLPRFRE